MKKPKTLLLLLPILLSASGLVAEDQVDKEKQYYELRKKEIELEKSREERKRVERELQEMRKQFKSRYWNAPQSQRDYIEFLENYNEELKVSERKLSEQKRSLEQRLARSEAQLATLTHAPQSADYLLPSLYHWRLQYWEDAISISAVFIALPILLKAFEDQKRSRVATLKERDLLYSSILLNDGINTGNTLSSATGGYFYTRTQERIGDLRGSYRVINSTLTLLGLLAYGAYVSDMHNKHEWKIRAQEYTERKILSWSHTFVF